MRAHRLKLLIALFATWAALAAPAAASERTEAQQYAAALQEDLAWDPATADAILVDWRARSAAVMSGCRRAVRLAAKDEDRSFLVFLAYTTYAVKAVYVEWARWSRAADGRLAAIDTRSRALANARTARLGMTETYDTLVAIAPDDFCAEMNVWWAKGFKGLPRTLKRLGRLMNETSGSRSDARVLARGRRILRRHGATKAQADALTGTRPAPFGEDAFEDPVLALIEGPGERRNGGPTREG